MFVGNQATIKNDGYGALYIFNLSCICLKID